MKAVDAQENPFGIIHAGKFDEVQKYLSVTRHSYAPYVVMIGKKYWDGLSPDEQKILEDSCVEARDYQRGDAGDQREDRPGTQGQRDGDERDRPAGASKDKGEAAARHRQACAEHR